MALQRGLASSAGKGVTRTYSDYRDYISSPWVWKRYNASPAEPRRPVAPLVQCGDSWCYYIDCVSLSVYRRMLHLFILFATTLGLVSAGVVTEFFEYFVYDMLRLRGYGWEFCG